MKVYLLHRRQKLPVSRQEAWEFFSSPKNLPTITPPEMKFKILHSGAEKMFAGQIIHYKVNVLPFLRMTWITKITEVDEPLSFTDTQLQGPYTRWIHTHRFEAEPEGIVMTDTVEYSLPLGFAGRLAHWLFVARQLNAIFDFRYEVLKNHFHVRQKNLLAPQ